MSGKFLTIVQSPIIIDFAILGLYVISSQQLVVDDTMDRPTGVDRHCADTEIEADDCIEGSKIALLLDKKSLQSPEDEQSLYKLQAGKLMGIGE